MAKAKANVKKTAKNKVKSPVKKKSVAKKSAPAKTPVKKVLKPAAKTVAKKSSAFAEQLLYATLKVLDERQAEDIVTIHLGDRHSVADYLVIASGRATRQIAAMADYLREAFETLGIQKARIEGLPEANWVLVDGGDIIVHLFRPEVRHYYNLETMWAERAKE